MGLEKDLPPGEELVAAPAIKAYVLREQVSTREKFYIESHYYQVATGDLEKARQAYELWEQVYPRDVIPHNQLSVVYAGFGQHEKALAEARECNRLQASGMSYASLVGEYTYLNQLAEAQATAKEAQAKSFDSPALHLQLYGLAFLQNDTAGMKQQVDWAVGKPGVEDMLLCAEAETAAHSGRLRKAREFWRQAEASALRSGEKERVVSWQLDAAWTEALFGNAAEARQQAGAALALTRSRYWQSMAAAALGMAGDGTRAQTLADDLAKHFPDDTILQLNNLPLIHAQLALNRNNASMAIEFLQVAAPTELGNRSVSRLLARQGLSRRSSGQRSRRRVPENPRPSRNCTELKFRCTRSSSNRQSLRNAGRHRQSQSCLSGFPHAVERRRP